VLQRHAGPLIDGVVQLTLTGDEDSAEFVIDGRMLSDAYPVGGAGSQTGVRRGRAPQADASITLSLTTFGALARCSSELTRSKLASAHYLSGRLQVSGDLGLAADFFSLLDVVLRSGCWSSCESTEL
jgi:hypothetical protein